MFTNFEDIITFVIYYFVVYGCDGFYYFYFRKIYSHVHSKPSWSSGICRVTCYMEGRGFDRKKSNITDFVGRYLRLPQINLLLSLCNDLCFINILSNIGTLISLMST